MSNDIKNPDRLRESNVGRFQEFCDRVAVRAIRRGLTEEKLVDILADDKKHVKRTLP